MQALRRFFSSIRPLNALQLLIGSAILAFGLCHIHSHSGITEGGVLGLTLLLQRWPGISPAVSGLILNFACYLLGFFLLGGKFILYSAIAGGGFSLFYALFEQLPPLFPDLTEHPLAAALLGAVFVGVGVGICVCANGAPCGDDALAMSLSHVTHVNIRWIYLISDLTVLGLSLTYIPLRTIGYSLLTVILSGQIIGWIQELPPFIQAHRKNINKESTE